MIISAVYYVCGAIRVVKHAVELKKPVMLLNVGPSRADTLPGVEKIDMSSGSVMREVASAIMYVFLATLDQKTYQICRGTRAFEDPVVKNMLHMGIVRPPSLDDDPR